jgi:hypothetical protein
MTLVHILQGLNLVTFIALIYQIRMLVKTRKNLIALSEKLLADLTHVGNMLTALNEERNLRGESERC